jgi:hypothetical protein
MSPQQMSPDLLATETSVPCQSVAGMRDQLAHHYSDILKVRFSNAPWIKMFRFIDSVARLRAQLRDFDK